MEIPASAYLKPESPTEIRADGKTTTFVLTDVPALPSVVVHTPETDEYEAERALGVLTPLPTEVIEAPSRPAPQPPSVDDLTVATVVADVAEPQRDLIVRIRLNPT